MHKSVYIYFITYRGVCVTLRVRQTFQIYSPKLTQALGLVATVALLPEGTLAHWYA